MVYTEKEIQQMEMFGCTTAQIRQEFNEARNGKVYLMGILSDVQESTDYYMEYQKEDIDRNSKLLNKAKYVIDRLL